MKEITNPIDFDHEVTSISETFNDLIVKLKVAKPQDRSELDRDWQIVITELSKVRAYFEYEIHQ